MCNPLTMQESISPVFRGSLMSPNSVCLEVLTKAVSADCTAGCDSNSSTANLYNVLLSQLFMSISAQKSVFVLAARHYGCNVQQNKAV